MDSGNITLIGGIVLALVPLVGVVIVNIIVARRQGAKLDTVAEKTAQIETSVNSAKTKLEGELTAARGEIALLRENLADKDATAGLLAQAQATAHQNGAKIDSNTAAIKENTKKRKP